MRNVPGGFGELKKTINIPIDIATIMKITYANTAVAIGFIEHHEYYLIETKHIFYDG